MDNENDQRCHHDFQIFFCLHVAQTTNIFFFTLFYFLNFSNVLSSKISSIILIFSLNFNEWENLLYFWTWGRSFNWSKILVWICFNKTYFIFPPLWFPLLSLFYILSEYLKDIIPSITGNITRYYFGINLNYHLHK